MNGQNEPVTRAELQEELSALESRLVDRMRDMETALLTAFHSYSKGVSVRFKKIEADVSNINTATAARLAAIEDRIMEIERRLPSVV